MAVVKDVPCGAETIATRHEDAVARGRVPGGVDGLLDRLTGCTLCAERFAATKTAHAPRPIFQIDPRARVLVAGQAPGMRVHQSGLPFDDPSGVRLRAWMGVSGEVFYDPARVAIVPMGHCFPGYDAKGSDLPPPRICAETWRSEVLAALPNLALTLVIGQYAQAWHLGPAPRGGVTARVAAWREGLPHILALPHPSWRNTAWLKRNPWFEAEVVPWLQRRLRALL
ncbi:MAG: uracil-DNA glycosylase family protein [Pseudomonadota bacterium]